MPGVIEIKSLIRLLSGGKGRHHSLSKEMVFEVAEIIRIAQKKIGERKSAETRLAGRAEIEGAAGHVGLGIIVVARLELQPEMVAVMARASESDLEKGCIAYRDPEYSFVPACT